MTRAVLALTTVSALLISCGDRSRESPSSDEVEKTRDSTEPRAISVFAGPRAARCLRSGPNASITNLGALGITELVLWVYRRHPETAAVVARASERHAVDIAMGAEMQLSTGADGDECEVSEVIWADGTRWSNKNLIHRVGEPRGQESDEALVARAQPTVVVEKATQSPMSFAFKNVSGRPLTVNQVAVRFLDSKGRVLRQAAIRSELELSNNATRTTALDYAEAQIPSGTEHIQTSVTTVTFRDGARETLTNHN